MMNATGEGSRSRVGDSATVVAAKGADAIEAYWWRRIPNFGDALVPHLLRALSGRNVRWSNVDGRPVLASIGSVVQNARTGWHVWGSGLISADAQTPGDLTVHAVRGPLTREALAQRGAPADVPMGDPALLLPRVFPPSPKALYDWGIAPHYIDYPAIAWLAMRNRWRVSSGGTGRIAVISPFLTPQEYVRRLTSCRRVAASSLHGIIAADAYRIPNVWFATSNNLVKTLCLKHTTFVHDHFKYFDYFMSVGRELLEPTVADLGFPWDEWNDRAESWSPITWDAGPLLRAFPLPLSPRFESERSSGELRAGDSRPDAWRSSEAPQ